MSLQSSITMDKTDEPRTMKHRRCGGKAKWSGLNIAALVIGFAVFWPLGFFFLYWILSGRQVRDLPEKMQAQWNKYMQRDGAAKRYGVSDNVVFNEYQQAQYDRIYEIKQEIKTRARHFQAFRADAKRRSDEEEFNRFMASTPHSESQS